LVCRDTLKKNIYEAIREVAGITVTPRLFVDCASVIEVSIKNVPVESVTFPFVESTALAMELRGLATIINLYNATTDVKLWMIAKINTLADVFNAIPAAKVGSPEIHSLRMLYHAMPLSIPSSCERSFSVMRREKTWIRSKSGQSHLNIIMFSDIHKKAMDEINFERVACEFMQHTDGRKHYFGV